MHFFSSSAEHEHLTHSRNDEAKYTLWYHSLTYFPQDVSVGSSGMVMVTVALCKLIFTVITFHKTFADKPDIVERKKKKKPKTPGDRCPSE